MSTITIEAVAPMRSTDELLIRVCTKPAATTASLQSSPSPGAHYLVAAYLSHEFLGRFWVLAVVERHWWSPVSSVQTRA